MRTMILKVTEKCNSNCAYCDVVANRAQAQHMPLDVLEIVFKQIHEFLRVHPEETINVTFHGGEPLLVGVEFYKAAYEFQQKYFRDTRDRINYSIQSNITLLSQDYVEIFRDLGIEQIGTSYDPEPHIRGPGIPNDSDRYNRLFMQGDAVASKHGIQSGIIYVVTKKSLRNPLKVFYYLTNLRPSGFFNMHPVILYHNRREDLAITPAEYVAFLGAIFPVWWKYQKRYPHVEPFCSMLETIRDGKLSLSCCSSGACAYQHVNVDPLGETSQCGRSSDWGLLPYGNIRERSLEEIFSDSKRDELYTRNDVLCHGACGGCRFWTICHGDCPLDSYPKYSDFLHRSEWGCSKKAFIEQYFEPITELRFTPS
ncbi:MAG: radical SAM protein [Thermodesulfobacteriota bacterium]